jgi:hypothetical protein
MITQVLRCPYCQGTNIVRQCTKEPYRLVNCAKRQRKWWKNKGYRYLKTPYETVRPSLH